MATCAEIVGRELGGNVAEDSFSYLPALTGTIGSTPTRPAIVHHSGDGMFSIRKRQWKLILGRGSGGFSEPARIEPKPGEPQGQLYDMETDFQETDNLWSDRPEIVKELTSILDRYIATGRSNFRG
jgi:hypothetical protein